MSAMALVAPRRWLREEASRLDASCYATGGTEARERVINASPTWLPLARVAQIFVGARFARTYIASRSRGVPYLTGSDMLLSDLVDLPLLSRARTPQLAKLTIQSTWTLISCSGTIGRTVYVRPDMDGMVLSHDAIRVVTEKKRVVPGFLFAFLSSRDAQAMIRQRTYGSVVQHIEPHHLRDVPVPTPEQEFQEHIGQLVDRAATARTEAAQLLDEAATYFDGSAGPMASAHDHARAIGSVSRDSLDGRLDAFHYVGWAAEPSFSDGDGLGTLAQVISTPRVPRVYVERGLPFLSGIDVFRVRVTPRVHLARWVADDYGACVRAGDLAVQGSGQRYGLLGRVASIGERLDGWAASHDLFRIRTAEADNRARIFAFLRSDSGHRVMLRHSYGTSIPHVNPAGIAAIRVPELPADLISAARRALELREQADRDEQRAIDEVEAWLA